MHAAGGIAGGVSPAAGLPLRGIRGFAPGPTKGLCPLDSHQGLLSLEPARCFFLAHFQIVMLLLRRGSEIEFLRYAA